MINVMIQILSEPLAERIGWSLIHFIWQGAVIALLLAFVLRAMQHRSPKSRYMAGCVAMLAISACPLFTSILTEPSANAVPDVRLNGPVSTRSAPASAASTDSGPDSAVIGEQSPASAQSGNLPGATDISPHVVDPATIDGSTAASSAAEGIERSLRPFLPWFVGCWLFGVVLCSFRLMIAWSRVQKLRNAGVTRASTALIAAAQRLADRIGVQRSVQLLESTIVEVPLVIGWLKPVILLPVASTTGLSTQQLDAIIAHELAHIRRWDYPVNLIQCIVETVLFYHPAVWWVSAKIRQEREKCCDDIACAVCGNPVEYAWALVQMEELRRPESLVVAASGGDLMDRVRRLVAPSIKPHGAHRGSAGFVALLLVSEVMAGLRLAAEGETQPANSDIPGAMAVLRGGDLTLEFSALSRHPSDSQSWWRPNGDAFPSDFASDFRFSRRDYEPLTWHLGFLLNSSVGDVGVGGHLHQWQAHSGWTSTSTHGRTGTGSQGKKVHTSIGFDEDYESTDVDILLSLEAWRPWQTNQLTEDTIQPWSSAATDLTRSADNAKMQPGDFIVAFEGPVRKTVEVFVAWPEGSNSLASIEMQGFDHDGNEIEPTGGAGYEHANGAVFVTTRKTLAGFRYRLRYYTDKVSFFNASLIPGQTSQVTHRVVRLDVPKLELTPERVADEIEAAMKRFESAEYTAEALSTVNTNSSKTDEPAILVEGHGRFRFRSDGTRWFVDEKSFTYSQGASNLIPTTNVAGFDGSVHHSRDKSGTIVLGEDDLSNARLAPREVFWHAARNPNSLLSALRRETARVVRDNVAADGRRVVENRQRMDAGR